MAAKKKMTPSMPKGDADAARFYKALAKFAETRSADTAARAAHGRGYLNLKAPAQTPGRSADAAAGAAAAKKATRTARATGQTKQSAMDAVSRRYKPESRMITRTENPRSASSPRKITSLVTVVNDKKTGYPTRNSRGGINYTSRDIRNVPVKQAAKKKRPTPKP